VAGLPARASNIGSGSGCLDLVRLSPLMARTSGRPEIPIGLIDGPIAVNHPDLPAENIRELPGQSPGACLDNGSTACAHGTFIAGVLLARRGSVAPAICPGCSLLVRPIFTETIPPGEVMPGAAAEELADAIIEVIGGGARIINLSVAFQGSSPKGENALGQALDHALRRGVIVVAAAGNQATLGSSVITRHRWVIPVVAYDQIGHPMASSNIGASIGRHGLGAPGEGITSLGPTAEPVTMGGTSVATPFVGGAIALLWSDFPTAPAATVRSAVAEAAGSRRVTVVPPLLNAWAAHQRLLHNLS
jgi:subtilisin family serine protease